ncbi:octaprenyl-diphosphate synthase (plasmid) [Legionella adelaidensis]|uniref:Octaprenyl diphosphate synthase n=1 Tax=Legionella adelaidensis TaxID=45056 RepID=A0A0W0R3H1_9GAMM|nr:polyprenyl synthetase family protein [Legionella adelaidensis]KTC65605.1 octaprenyl-diphosphate synthase [Legionella adelaidensis]VEH85198.1 octaprenyl-diphosphate synthase [Legionella adelaidensis]
MTIHQLRTLVSKDFEAVNALIIEKTQSQVTLIDDLTNHIVQSGGKRLRPLLVLLASRACNYLGMDHIILATMVEFFHTATLLHDDVIDESTLRRGRETANEIWGSKASILVGDHLFTQYMQLMIAVGNMKIMRLLTDISYQIGCGELKQLANRNNPAVTEEEYFEVIRSKTSLLFAASSTLGALISGSDETTERALYDFGLHVGNAFQLIDDALDYCSDPKTLGKNIGDDLADGKPTLPLIHVLRTGTPEQKACVNQSIRQGALANLPAILEAITETKAIEFTREVAAREVDKALTALQHLPDSEYKEALKAFAYYAIERDH